MRAFRTLIALVFLATLFIIFLSTLHLEKTHSHRPEQKEIRKHHNHITADKHNATTTTPFPRQVSLTSAENEVVGVSVSDTLTRTIPQNNAYWNRLLYSAVGKHGFMQHPPWSHCRHVTQDLLKTNIHDFASYPSMFQDFLMAMNCRSPPLVINQPNKCLGDDLTFLLFAIKSRPGHFEQRQSVRETWGRENAMENGLRVRTLFLLGKPSPNEPDISVLLSMESKTFKDILQWDFNESLLNLTLKMTATLRWTLKNCPRVSFLFSGDDDVFVNTPALLNYLQSIQPPKVMEIFVGHVISTAAPLRDPKSKYYIPLSFYDGPYPPYIGGGGFVISGSLIQRLDSISNVIPAFPIDDVYTGMCLKALGISPEPHSGFQTFDVAEQSRENLCVHKGLILIHRRSPSELKKLWRGINSPLLTC